MEREDDWTIISLASRRVGRRYVSVWKTRSGEKQYGWEVRLGTPLSLCLNGGPGCKKLVGYEDDLEAAKAAGMAALHELTVRDG